MTRTFRPVVAGAALVIALLGGQWMVTAAQDATPVAPEAALPSGVYHAHIHAGTCSDFEASPVAALAEVLFPVSLEAEMPAAAEDVPVPVGVSATDVEPLLDAMLAEPHVINVATLEAPTESVACGVIAGEPDERGNLFIGLRERDGSGIAGSAWLMANSASTTVTLFLTDDSSGHEHGAAEAAATPAR